LVTVMVVEVVLQNVGRVDPIVAAAGTVMVRAASAWGGTNSVTSRVTLQAATVFRILGCIILIGPIILAEVARTMGADTHQGGRCRRIATGRRISLPAILLLERSRTLSVRSLILGHDRVITCIVVVRDTLLVVNRLGDARTARLRLGRECVRVGRRDGNIGRSISPPLERIRQEDGGGAGVLGLATGVRRVGADLHAPYFVALHGDAGVRRPAAPGDAGIGAD